MSKKPEHNLPGNITSIRPQKKNKDRYSIFVDDTFLIGVADSTLLNHQLSVGKQITIPSFRHLQRDEGRNKAKNYILKLLSRREHARKELFVKAKQKDYPSEIIESVLDELEGKEFINERSFALKFTKDKASLNNWGPYKIGAHLRKKGITKSVSNQIIKDVFDTIDLESRFSELVLKRKRHFLREKNSFKRKQKVVNYLLQKGYQPGSIYRHIETLMKILE